MHYGRLTLYSKSVYLYADKEPIVIVIDCLSFSLHGLWSYLGKTHLLLSMSYKHKIHLRSLLSFFQVLYTGDGATLIYRNSRIAGGLLPIYDSNCIPYRQLIFFL